MRNNLLTTIVLAGSLLSCQPKVITFTVTPLRVTSADSIHLSWQTRGKASMAFHRKKIAVPPDSAEALEFILTANRGSKHSAPAIRQVTVVPPVSRDDLALALTGRSGDTLVYTGLKDTLRYPNYTVVSQNQTFGTDMTIFHAGRQCNLGSAGGTSTCMSGLPYAGPWEARIKMTPAQLTDPHSRPTTCTILTTIKIN